MSDTVDDAKKLEEQSLTHALNTARNAREKPLVVEGKRLCLRCEIVVPQKRIDVVNAVRCIECQMLHEIKLKQNGG